MRIKRRSTLVAATMLASLLVPAMGQTKEYPPQVARGVTVPAGFVAVPFATLDSLPTSLAWGADTGDGLLGGMTSDDDDHGTLLYVTATRNPFGPGGEPVLDGKIYAFSDEGTSEIVAQELDQPLGIVMGPDETLYVSENDSGPGRGRITALRDNNADGIFEARRTVIKNIPNGRHQTNGMVFGPDGKLYLANGNATDDGIECGPNFGPNIESRTGELPSPLHELYNDTFRNVECPAGHVERKPWTGSIIRVDPAWNDLDLLADVTVDADRFYGTYDPATGEIDGSVLDDEKVLVSSGYRNIYDVDFRPGAPTEIWTPMNGSDDPSSGEPLYGFDALNEEIVGFDEETEQPIFGPVIEDAGFPSCLYDPHINPFPEPSLGHSHPGIPDPEDNLNPDVIERFGPCPKDTVMRPKDIYDEGHEGTAGMTFERGNNFPARYNNGLFTAEWGSLWNLNGATVTGHKVIHHEVNADGTLGREREFMTGVLPIDVTFGPDGFLYVADMTGQIYQVQFVTDAATPDVVTIDMTNNQFVPQVVNVVQGQTVRWLNLDDNAHTVTCFQKVPLIVPKPIPGGGEESPLPPSTCTEMDSPGPVAKGGSHSHTFDGEVAVYHYHSKAVGSTEENTMRGTIVVHLMKR